MNWIEQLYSIPPFKKYSQAGEEGYLEHILSNIPSAGKYIVELGAWDGFHLSNTRYFIEKGYKALLVDGDNHGMEEVKEHFVSKENVLDIFKQYEVPESFDLFCIDLDGNDIYILDQVLKKYKPNVIIAEFNPIFPPDVSASIPYNPNHIWGEDDYYGFSFLAGLRVMTRHGYTCIFQNDNLNMYFVRNELINVSVPKVTYTQGQYHPKSVKNDWVCIE